MSTMCVIVDFSAIKQCAATPFCNRSVGVRVSAMTITQHELQTEDVLVIEQLRKGAAAQRGKYFGSKARAPFDAMKASVIAAPGVRTEAARVGGVPGWWCRPSGAAPHARLLYLHGGAFALGSAQAFCNQASHYAKLTGADTFVAEYRLAPEHPFPAAVDDAWAAYRGLAEQGATRIALAGDSAGGSLALGVLTSALGPLGTGLPKPCAAAVMSPWVDLALAGASMRERAESDPIFTPEVLSAFVADYLQGQDPLAAAASPLYASLAGLPPIRIDVGEDEILLDDSTRFAERARAAGVNVTLHVWAGMPHSFQSAVGKLSAADRALGAAGRFLREQLS